MGLFSCGRMKKCTCKIRPGGPHFAICLYVQRTEATIRAPNGQTFRVTKGAAHAVLSLVQTNKEIIASSVNKKVCVSAAA